MDPDWTSFPRSEQGLRLLQGLGELIDDLKPITDCQKIDVPQRVAAFADLDGSRHAPWYHDDDITSDVGGPSLQHFQVPWLSGGTETNLKGTVMSIVTDMLSPQGKPFDARVAFMCDNPRKDLPSLAGADPRLWEGRIIMYLATSDPLLFLELFHKTLSGAWSALKFLQKVDSDVKNIGAPVDPILVDQTWGVLWDLTNYMILRVNHHRQLIEFLFVANPRFPCLLDLSIQIDLNLLVFVTFAFARKMRLSSHESWLNQAYLLRCIAYKAWIRWGWYTTNNKRNRRDLYIALDCLEESILAKRYLREEVPPSKLAPIMLNLARFYRIAHKYSGSVEELNHALNWGRQGLELLLEIDTGGEGRSVQALVVTAQYDLSSMLSELFGFTHYECDAREALNLAAAAMRGLGSDAYQTFSAGLVAEIEYNYRHCRSRIVFQPEVPQLVKASSHPYQRLLRQRKMQYTSHQFMQVPRPTLQPLAQQGGGLVNRDASTLESIRCEIEGIPGMGIDSLGNLITPPLWAQSEDSSPALRNQMIQTLEMLLTFAEIPGPHLRKYGDKEGDVEERERALTLLMLEKVQDHMTSVPLTDVTRLRQLLDRWEGEHEKAAFYTYLYARTRDNRDREAAIVAFKSASGPPSELPPGPSVYKDGLGPLRLLHLQLAIELHWDHFQATQDEGTLDTTVLYITQLLDEARVQREALRCECGSPAITQFIFASCQAEGCRSLSIRDALLSVCFILHPLREKILGVMASSEDPQMTYTSTIGTLFQIPPDFQLLLDIHMPPSCRNILPCISDHRQLTGELMRLEWWGGDPVKVGYMILKYLLSQGPTMASAWQPEYQDALHALVSLVPQYFNLSSTLEERTVYQNRDIGLNAIIDFLIRGSSLILKHESASTALHFLEVARGTIFRNMLEYRVDLGDLTLTHPAYASELRAILHRLEAGFAEPLPELVPDTGRLELFSTLSLMGQRGQDADRLGQLLTEIRQLPGYECFMIPRYEGEQFALDAARDGPIVIVSAFGESHGHAILVLSSGITSIPLPGLTEEEAKNQLQVISEMNEWYLIGVQKKLRAMLKWLWESVVHPILIALGFAGRRKRAIDLASIDDIATLPRVWWVGVGPMSQAPFHAAGKFPGPHFDSKMHKPQYTAQYCISSYTPTIKALMFTRGQSIQRQYSPKSRKQPEATSHSDTEPVPGPSTNNVANMNTTVDPQDTIPDMRIIEPEGQEDTTQHKALVVTMPRTPAEEQMGPPCPLSIKIRGSSLSDLDVATESQFVKAAIGSINGTVDFLPSPEVDDVLFHLSTYNIVHFACHGEVDEANPLRSRLVFQKFAGPIDTPVRDYLTIRDILMVRALQDQTQAEDNLKLVYLSACSSASNRCSELSHEPLHIASVFQLAGFNHAIGTLWDSEDDVCVQVARTFYEYLAKIQASNRKGKDRYGLRTWDGCAEALHIAVELMRRKYWKAPHLWAPFMHWGA